MNLQRVLKKDKMLDVLFEGLGEVGVGFALLFPDGFKLPEEH